MPSMGGTPASDRRSTSRPSHDDDVFEQPLPGEQRRTIVPARITRVHRPCLSIGRPHRRPRGDLVAPPLHAGYGRDPAFRSKIGAPRAGGLVSDCIVAGTEGTVGKPPAPS